MAIAAHATGTQTTTVTTEHTLTAVNVAGVFTLHVDLQPMAAQDVIELRVYQMTLTAGTERVVYFTAYYGAQPDHDAIKVSVPIGNELTDTNALKFTLKQTFGSSRNIPWKVLKYT